MNELDVLDDLELPTLNADSAQSCNRRKAPFRRIPLRDALARECAWLASNIVYTSRLHGVMVHRGMVKDDDALGVLGLQFDCGDGVADAANLREAARASIERWRRYCERPHDRLQRNILQLGNAVELSDLQMRVLRIAVVASTTPDFLNFCSVCKIRTTNVYRHLSGVLGVKSSKVFIAMRPSGKLRRLGFFADESDGFDSHPLKLHDWVCEGLKQRDFDLNKLVRRIVKASPAPKLAMEDFVHIADRDLVLRFLTDACVRKRKGANVLIHGDTGAGKTEFVRTLAAHLGARLYEVPNDDADGDPISGTRRFAAFAICQRLLAASGTNMLLFDEVEDVFGSCDPFGWFGRPGVRVRDGDDLRKSWINETLESSPVPTVWVCNTVAAMDPAYLRRFDIIVEFGPSNRTVRKRVIDRYFRRGYLSPSFVARLADDERIAPAHVERAARVVRTLRSRNVAEREREVERLLIGSFRAGGDARPLASAEIPEHYDPNLLNVDANLAEIADGLARGSNARLCLYGMPGTGKTAFAHYLGRRLDRPVLVRRGSDMLNKYVGGTEARIARAFAQAKDDGSILVIDEADGFLRSRAGAERQWEVTQVNELLTQMEAFDGIFVASTNLLDTLDAAALRRFDFKIRFGYLRRDQRRSLLSRICADAIIDADIQARLDRLECITPGDYANALRQLRVRGQAPTPARLVGLLEREASIKPEGRHRSVGFV